MTDPRRAALDRAEELERRAWAGTDDIAYCIKWAGIHRAMAEVIRLKESGGR